MMSNVAEWKLQCYVDVDVVEQVCAATGEPIPRWSRAVGGDAMAGCSDAEEVPEDESFLLSTVAASRRTPSAL